jgi:membrane protease YdiL (CAAX protease family)
MKFLVRTLLEIVLAIVVLFIAIVVGNILYRLIGDLFSPQGMDRSNDAVIGASAVFALIVMIVYILVRIIWRKNR